MSREGWTRIERGWYIHPEHGEIRHVFPYEDSTATVWALWREPNQKKPFGLFRTLTQAIDFAEKGRK
jgi:hypothetical protein